MNITLSTSEYRIASLPKWGCIASLDAPMKSGASPNPKTVAESRMIIAATARIRNRAAFELPVLLKGILADSQQAPGWDACTGLDAPTGHSESSAST